MKRQFLFAIGFLLCLTVSAQAAILPDGTLLTITPGLVTGPGENDLAGGSGFAMGDGIGNPSGRQIDGWTAMLPGTDGGIIIGQTQPPGAIDAVWMFFASKGWHLTTAAPHQGYTQCPTLDFTGWTVFWNGTYIPMGDAGSYTYTDNMDGTYQINGVKVVSHPTDPNFVFNDVVYTLHLEGDIPFVIDEYCAWLCPCDDGNACNGIETCDLDAIQGGLCICLPGTSLDCDDGDPCTLDSCDPACGCQHTSLLGSEGPTGPTCNDGCDNDGDGMTDNCPPICVGELSATIRGGGQRPTTTDRQIMVEFAVQPPAGCILDAATKSVTVSPGTTLLIDFTAGSGPPPSEITIDDVSICNPGCPDSYALQVTGTHKLFLSNKGTGGKDTDRITIDVQ